MSWSSEESGQAFTKRGEEEVNSVRGRLRLRQVKLENGGEGGVDEGVVEVDQAHQVVRAAPYPTQVSEDLLGQLLAGFLWEEQLCILDLRPDAFKESLADVHLVDRDSLGVSVDLEEDALGQELDKDALLLLLFATAFRETTVSLNSHFNSCCFGFND